MDIFEITREATTHPFIYSPIR